MKRLKKYSLTKKKLLNTYGATYTMADLILTVIIYCIAIGTVCYLQKLNIGYSMIIMISALCMLPLIISAYFKYKKEKKRYEDYCLYFESVKMFFKTHGKIIIALEETSKLFNDEKSEMKICIEQAIIEVKNTGNYEKALSYIETKYQNTYLIRLHNLLITGEKNGSESVYYNLDGINYKDWKKDIALFQKKKKSAKYMFYLMAAISMCISIYSIVVYASDPSMLKMLVSNATYQLYTLVELECMLILFLYVYIDLTNKKWIRSDE